MKTFFTTLILVCILSCDVAKDASTSTDEANIQGIWLAQTESLNGIKKDVTFQYIFSGDTITFIDENSKQVKYSFKLDTTGHLKLVTILPLDTPVNTNPVSVGYELKGDSLKLVIAPAGLTPTELSDKNNQELIICKRKKSE